MSEQPVPSMRSTRSREVVLLALCAGLLVLALLGPRVELPDHYHAFADARAWQFLPNAMDVLSNLGFALFGVLGLLRLRLLDRPIAWTVNRQMAALFFLGLVLTALCSGYYHVKPDGAGLWLDRLGMVVAFAGLLGLAAADRVSDRAARALAVLMLVAGPAAATTAMHSLDQLAWVVVQFGGLAILVWLVLNKPLAGAWPVRWWGVIGAYALAKLFELGDAAIFEWTGHWVSGHSLKHLVASCAALPVLSALRPLHPPRVRADVAEPADVAASRTPSGDGVPAAGR